VASRVEDRTPSKLCRALSTHTHAQAMDLYPALDSLQAARSPQEQKLLDLVTRMRRALLGMVEEGEVAGREIAALRAALARAEHTLDTQTRQQSSALDSEKAQVRRLSAALDDEKSGSAQTVLEQVNLRLRDGLDAQTELRRTEEALAHEKGLVRKLSLALDEESAQLREVSLALHHERAATAAAERAMPADHVCQVEAHVQKAAEDVENGLESLWGSLDISEEFLEGAMSCMSPILKSPSPSPMQDPEDSLARSSDVQELERATGSPEPKPERDSRQVVRDLLGGLTGPEIARENTVEDLTEYLKTFGLAYKKPKAAAAVALVKAMSAFSKTK